MDLRDYIGKHIHVLYRRGIPPKLYEKDGILINVLSREICLRRFDCHGKPLEVWVRRPLNTVDVISIIP